MTTYKEIQSYVKSNSGFVPKTCWIADVKKQCGLPVNEAWNREGADRVYPCPEEKVECIKNALKYFGMISR